MDFPGWWTIGAGSVGPGHGSREQEWHDDEPAGKACGTVKFYDAVKGFGFILLGDSGQDAFVHGRVLSHSDLDLLEQGQRVSAMVTEGARGPQATGHHLRPGSDALSRRRGRADGPAVAVEAG